MKKFKMHVLLICYLAMLFPLGAHAQISKYTSSSTTIQTGPINPIGPGPGPIPVTCPTPGVSASSVYSTLTTSSTTLCASNSPSSASATAQFSIVTNSNVLLRIAFQLYRGTSGGYTSLGVFCNNTSGSMFNASNSGQVLTDAISLSGSLFNTSGNYYTIPLVQYYCSSDNTWKTVTTGNSSNIVIMSILPQNASNNFSLNGLQNTGTIPVLNQCPSALQNLIMHNITTGSISNYQIKIEKSTNGISYAAPIASTLFTTSSMPSAIDLNALFGSNLTNKYTGYLRVSLCVNASGQCDNGLYVKSQVFQIQSIAAQAEYYFNRTVGNGINNNKLDRVSSLPITTPMPGINGTQTTPMFNFVYNIGNSPGWQGATTAGINNIVTNGNWSFKVYEVDGNTGVRKSQIIGATTYTAPDISYYNGGSSSSPLTFLFNSYSKTFDPTFSTNFYVDPNSNFGDGDVFFRSYYVWAKSNGASALSAFSAKTWCCEFSVSVNGCTISNKSYFKIASNYSLAFGQNAKMKNPNIENNFNVFPNPTTGEVTIQFASTNNNAISIIDNMGKIVKRIEAINSSVYKLDISDLVNGIYFYDAISNDQNYQGKIIKQ
jgi:hypothetical protein